MFVFTLVQRFLEILFLINNSTIAAKAAVTKSVDADTTVMGVPAHPKP